MTRIKHNADYAQKRREAYPPIEEQLDALWKGGQAAAEMRSRIEAVKARFPKPEGPPR